MVSNPRASLGARDLRSLNRPSPVWVEADVIGRPQTVRRRGWSEPRAVASMQDRWRIDDEWWRGNPISRLYHTLELDDGTLLTVYHDLVADAWYEQKESGVGSQELERRVKTT
jgi:hypothetical protein